MRCDNADSNVRQARVGQIAVMDQIARETTEASAKSQARRRQIEIAQAGVAAAVLSHRRNLDRIQAAKGLPIEALQSVQALANAQREYLRTLVDYDIRNSRCCAPWAGPSNSTAPFRARGQPRRSGRSREPIERGMPPKPAETANP